MLSNVDSNPEMADIKTKISNQSISFLNSTPGVYNKNDSDNLVQQPPKPGFSRKSSLVSLSKRSSQHTLNKPDSQQSFNQNTHTTRLSRSNSSIQSSIYTSPPKLLKRDSSRRIVSSALAGGDTFDENNIVFKMFLNLVIVVMKDMLKRDMKKVVMMTVLLERLIIC